MWPASSLQSTLTSPPTMLGIYAAILAVIPAATAVSDQFTPLRFHGDSPFCLDVAGSAIPTPGQPAGVIL